MQMQKCMLHVHVQTVLLPRRIGLFRMNLLACATVKALWFAAGDSCWLELNLSAI
jgi:hypothetical protein